MFFFFHSVKKSEGIVEEDNVSPLQIASPPFCIFCGNCEPRMLFLLLLGLSWVFVLLLLARIYAFGHKYLCHNDKTGLCE